MDNISRLFPFIWTYRYRLLASTSLGVCVALLWGINLTAAFPIVKLLLEQKSLHGHVDNLIKDADIASEKFSKRLLLVESQIEGYSLEKKEATDSAGKKKLVDQSTAVDHPGNSPPAEKKALAELLQDRTRIQKKLTGAVNSQSRLVFVKTSIMPWVPRDKFETFALIVVMIIVATGVKGVCVFLQDVMVYSVVEKVVMRVRKRCFKNVMTLDLETATKGGSGDLMSRFTYDTSLLSDGIKMFGGRLVREPLKAIVCLCIALFLNWQLTLMAMIFVPVLGIAFYRYGKMIKKASHRMMESMSRLYKILEETFDALKVVTAFGRSKKHQDVFRDECNSFYKKSMRLNTIDALTKPTTELLGIFAVFAAMLPGAYLVIRGETHIWGIRMAAEPIDPATLAALYSSLAGILDPCRKMSGIYTRLKRSNAAIDRIFNLMDQESKVKNPEKITSVERHQKSIQFQDIEFSYSTENPLGSRGLVLNGINLDVKLGEVIAFVGGNGCGKTTLLGLLPRLYDPQKGQVLIDDVPIQDMSLEDLRNQIGMVAQETILFDESIADNIAYGKEGATREEVERAAREAHVIDFSKDFPDGLDTQVGIKGKELSGGQRQRIALARAMIRDPAILILDEATSAIDSQSELLIHQALTKFAKGRTTFVITHSMTQSMLNFVSRVVVIDAGEIVASGTHDKLMASSEIYQHFYQAPTKKMAG